MTQAETRAVLGGVERKEQRRVRGFAGPHRARGTAVDKELLNEGGREGP